MRNESLAEEIRRMYGPDRVRCDEPMSAHTTFRIGGPADVFVSADKEILKTLPVWAKERGAALTVIGNGSNLLVSDRGVRGIVLEIGKGLGKIKEEEGGRLRVGAGVLLSKAARAAAQAGLSGMEFAFGIPGSIGGAVVMNAGAYGGQTADILCEVSVLTPSGESVTFRDDLSALELGYRHSSVEQHGWIVTEAVFALKPAPREEIYARMEDLRQRRLDKQPLEYPSAGSAFKRPEGDYAARLIDVAGLRGARVGGAQISEKHCGFIINTGGATAKEVIGLMKVAKDTVKEKFGVSLEPEIRMIGDF